MARRPLTGAKQTSRRKAATYFSDLTGPADLLEGKADFPFTRRDF